MLSVNPDSEIMDTVLVAKRGIDYVVVESDLPRNTQLSETSRVSHSTSIISGTSLATSSLRKLMMEGSFSSLVGYR